MQGHSLTKRAVSRRSLIKGAAIGAGAIALHGAGMGSVSAQTATPVAPFIDPYLVPTAQGVQFSTILTVGGAPAPNGYRMVGIPDGLGAYRDGRNIQVLMSHELGAAAGIPRAHGSKGAFVSQITIDRDLKVLAGKDLTPSPLHVYQWNIAASSYVQGTTVWDRFCSSDLPDPKALRQGNRGTSERLFLVGEETNEGRGWAHIATGANAGQAWQLPRMGRMPFENLLASPHTKDRTVVMIMDDGSANTAPIAANYPCELYVYVGTKQSTGTPVERAGLTNGKLYGARVRRGATVVTEESNQYGLGDATTGYVPRARFELVELGVNGDVSAMTGLQLEQDAINKQVLRMQRIEDGAWDPRNRREDDFYFVTTASFVTNSRLWRLRFDDIDDVLKGGEIEALLHGSEGPKMMDNIGMDTRGRILIQEDPGGQAHLAKIWMYSVDSGSLVQVAQHNPKYFEPASPEFLTIDEESSGVIDAEDLLGRGWFLVDVQAHRTHPDPELVQHGQLLAMYVDPRLGRDDDEGDGD